MITDVLKLSNVINDLIDECNKLYEIMQSKKVTPLTAGKAYWERQGLIKCLKLLINANFDSCKIELDEDNNIKVYEKIKENFDKCPTCGYQKDMLK